MGRRKAQPQIEEQIIEEQDVIDQGKDTPTPAEPKIEDDEIEVSIDELRQILSEANPPRHTMLFDDEIHMESVNELINTLSQHEYVDLFVSTPGGAVHAMDVLIHYLNSRKYEIRIFLTLGVASAGTLLLTDFEGEIHFTENLTYLMIHKVDFLSYRNRREGETVKNLQRDVERMNKQLLRKYKAVGFSKKHLDKFKAGKDVYIYSKSFKKLIRRREELMSVED